VEGKDLEQLIGGCNCAGRSWSHELKLEPVENIGVSCELATWHCKLALRAAGVSLEVKPQEG
jgi:hypothetical protein